MPDAQTELVDLLDEEDALIISESCYKPGAVSIVSFVGVWQATSKDK